MVHAYRGLICWRRDGDLARAREHAERALRWDKTNPDAVALMRAGNPIADKPTPLWHILVEGVWREPLEGAHADRLFRQLLGDCRHARRGAGLHSPV